MLLEWILSHKAVSFYCLFSALFALKLLWIVFSVPKGDDQAKEDKEFFGFVSLLAASAACASWFELSFLSSFVIGAIASAAVFAIGMWAMGKLPQEK